LESLKLLLNPETTLACIPISVVYGWFYYIVTILSPTYLEIYDFSTGTTGLCFLASGAGNIIGALFSGSLSDRIYKNSIEKNGGVVIKEFRLKPIYIGIPFVVVGAIMYGWLLYAHVHFMGPLVGFALCKLFKMIRNAVLN
jgi:predicted MFS family arabinose efflux permease